MTGRSAQARAARSAEAALEWVARVPVRDRRAVSDWRQAKEEARRPVAPTLDERLEDLRTFYGQYEALVETVCDGAQYGPDPKLAERYEVLRRWMQTGYPPMRRYVTAYLQYEAGDARRGMDLHTGACDAFQALFAAPTLDEFLRGDDGMMISRIMRTRDALNLYADHLRHLKARE